MKGPVAVYYTVPIEAKTRLIKNPLEFIEYCKSTTNEIFLYDLIFIPSMPVYTKLDPETFHDMIEV